MSDPQPNSKPRKGCLFYGCLTLGILSLAVLIGGGIGMYVVYRQVTAVVEEFASTEPMELPKVRYTEIDQEQFDKRLKIFAGGLAEGKPTVPLVLKGQDLNMLLASSDDLQALAEGLRVSVEGDEIKGMISLQLGDIGSPFFRDRYLNGEASFKVSLQDGQLAVSPSEIVVNGKAIPQSQLDKLREFNLVDAINQDPDVMETLNRLDVIEVKDGTVKVIPREQE